MSAESIDLTVEKESSSIVLDTRRSRPRFFDGKFLTAADLTQEQSYLLTRQADLGRTLGFGVVEGLRVTQSNISASALPNPAASVAISRGNGLTPSGEIVFLPEDLIVDLDNVKQMQRLSAVFGLTREPQQPFQNLGGLFVLGLRAVEFTANPTPTYPPSVDGNSALRDGEVIEATALVIVPYESDSSLRDPRGARTRAAREIFLAQKSPSLPAGVLPLAMLWLRNGTLGWVDEWLVRREAGDDDRFGFGFAPRALSEAHFYHYQDMIKDAPSAADGQLTAQSFLEITPAAGPLPKGVLNQADFTQAYFPAEARVELALVPVDEIAALMEDSIDLPPIDLSLKPEDQDALAILVLAPVDRADYANVLATLKVQPADNTQLVLRNVVPPLLSQQRPIQALLKLNAAFLLKQSMSNGSSLTPTPVPPDFIDQAWRAALKKVGPLWYMRRRNIPDGQGLAGTPIKATASTPASSSAGDAATTTTTTPTPTGTPPAPPTGAVITIGRDTPAIPIRSKIESDLARGLAGEGLWGRFAFLRAISDAPTHGVLVKVLNDPLVLDNKLLWHALLTAIEQSLPEISESPEENFEQIQKDPEVKVLTPDLITKALDRIHSFDIVQGLKVALRGQEDLLDDDGKKGVRFRHVLGRTNRIIELADIGLNKSKDPNFPKLVTTVLKNVATGRAQTVSDAIDNFSKKD